jgi:hypothetical protein
VLSTTDGTHIPDIPFVEVGGNTGTIPPLQITRLVPKLNVGIIFGLTVTANVAFDEHWPASGVNVYVPEFKLSTTAGVHFPAIPFCDVVGKVGTLPPEQIDKLVPKPKVGTTLGFTVTVNV